MAKNNQIKTITSKFTVAGLAGIGTLTVLLFSGCSGCSANTQPQSEAVSEIVTEVSEIPSEIDTSEQPCEEISEAAPIVAELPELPILDENGNVYNPGMFTTEDVYAAIDTDIIYYYPSAFAGGFFCRKNRSRRNNSLRKFPARCAIMEAVWRVILWRNLRQNYLMQTAMNSGKARSTNRI